MTTPDPASGGAGPRPLLFTPLTMRGTTAKNRLVFSPMVQYGAKDGIANDFHLVHYGRMAQGGFGIVFTEATAVEQRGRIGYADLGLWDDRQIPALRRIANYVHDEGALLAVQLAHAGRKASSLPAMDGGQPLTDADAARGLAPWRTVGPTTQPVGPGWPEPRALSAIELHDIVQSFAGAASRAEAAGADIIEIHGAHGYLIASFLSPISNTRNDAYGRDRIGRMRLPLEIAVAVRDVWPVKKPLFFRASVVDGAEGGWNVDDTIELSSALRKVGVDVVDCSSGGLTGSATGSMVQRADPGAVRVRCAARRRRQDHGGRVDPGRCAGRGDLAARRRRSDRDRPAGAL